MSEVMTEVKIGGRVFKMKPGTPVNEVVSKKLTSIPEQYQNIKFADFIFTEENQSKLNLIYNFATDFERNKNKSLIITGKVGTGKTSICYLILKTVLENKYRGELVSTLDIFDKIKDAYNGKVNAEQTYINKLCNADLLIIDDFGVEFLNSWRYEKIYSLIDTRYIKKKATIFTTNLGIKELKKHIDERLMSRIIGMTNCVFEFGGCDWRLKKNG